MGNLPPSELKRAAAELSEEFPEGIRACGGDALRFTLTAAQTGVSHLRRRRPLPRVSRGDMIARTWGVCGTDLACRAPGVLGS